MRVKHWTHRLPNRHCLTLPLDEWGLTLRALSGGPSRGHRGYFGDVMPVSAPVLSFRPWVGTAGVVGALLLAGCSGNESPNVNPGANNAAKPAESITRQSAPSSQGSLISQINTLRRQSFSAFGGVVSDGSVDISGSNVVYTAAYRHAVNLNTANSGNYQPNGATGLPIGAETATVSTASTLLTLRGEFPNGNNAIFPALFTNTTPFARVAAVVGSPDILRNCQPSDVHEWGIFNGDQAKENGDPSDFRGFNLYTLDNANPSRYLFTPVDTAWYSWRGRLLLQRYDTLYVGYGAAADGAGSSSCICPPFPIFNGNFIGVMTTVSQGSGQAFGQPARTGEWPQPGATNVCPYGVDPDIGKTAVPAIAPVPYSGPPISLTFPTREPFLVSNVTLGLGIGFEKVSGAASAGFSSSYVAYFKNPTGGTFVAFPGGAGGFTALASTVPVDVANVIREGELLIIPTGPLEKNTAYQVTVRVNTASLSYTFPGPLQTNVQTWQFTTGNQ